MEGEEKKYPITILLAQAELLKRVEPVDDEAPSKEAQMLRADGEKAIRINT